MHDTATTVDRISAIRRDEVEAQAATEHRRVWELLSSLDDEDWAKPTDCAAWDVRAMAGHVLGMMEGFARFREWAHQMRAGGKAAGGGPFIDGMTAVQVRERAGLDRTELLARMAAAGPKAARARTKVPSPLRRMPMKEEVGGQPETWRLGYLLDVILTRDPWMHRVDISRATGREVVLTPEHDGRIIADVVAEWARRHGQPFTLLLHGPAGGAYTQGAGGEEIAVDAVEFCRILSGRASGTGLLTQEVPF
ncbi:MAG: maleylpyruvate isomerase family mycothiol-dependent enzyme [Acidimicrobiales bacterium]|nr:maleylpyruvate isomerase family mycothiol-dependent enzyme [Acidimicrobiales bacterium]